MGYGLPEETAKKTPAADVPFRFLLKQPLSAQLATIGLKPADFFFVAFSHRHVDHAGNGNLFSTDDSMPLSTGERLRRHHRIRSPLHNRS